MIEAKEKLLWLGPGGMYGQGRQDKPGPLPCVVERLMEDGWVYVRYESGHGEAWVTAKPEELVCPLPEPKKPSARKSSGAKTAKASKKGATKR